MKGKHIKKGKAYVNHTGRFWY